MASLNKTMLIGNVGNEPESRKFGENTKVSFSLATTKRYKSRSGDEVNETQWHNIIAWGKQAETISQYVHKGTQLYVDGELTYRTYDDSNGVKKTVSEIILGNFQLLGSPQRENTTSSNTSVEHIDDIPF